MRIVVESIKVVRDPVRRFCYVPLGDSPFELEFKSYLHFKIKE
jgi:hypothetical protein